VFIYDKGGSLCRYSGVDKTSADCGTGAPKITEYKNLCDLTDWIHFLCQRAVFWIIVMRAGSKCSLLQGTSITDVTELPRGGGGL